MKLYFKLILFVLLMVSVVACGGKKDKKGAGKEELDQLIASYSQENKLLADELERLRKEKDLLTTEIAKFNSLSEMDQSTIAKLKDLLDSSGGGVSIDGEGTLVLDNDITFTSGSDKLSDSGRNLLKRLLATGVLNGGKIYVMGHTDSDPIRVSKHTSNFELSAKRASHVVEYLLSLGVKGENLVVQGYGEFQPKGLSKSKQRRIAIKVVK